MGFVKSGRDARGFSMVELMVTILLVGILAAIVIPKMLGPRTEAKNTEAKSSLQAGFTAARSYLADNRSYANLCTNESTDCSNKISLHSLSQQVPKTELPGDASPSDAQGAPPGALWMGSSTGTSAGLGADPEQNTLVLCSLTEGGDTIFCIKDDKGVISYAKVVDENQTVEQVVRTATFATNTDLNGNAIAASTADDVPASADVESAPANETLPVITASDGTAVGDQLTGSPGSWTGNPTPTYSFSWKRCNSSGESCQSIAGADNSVYTLVTGDIGSRLKLSVLAENSVVPPATAESLPSSLVEEPASTQSSPSNTSDPYISGQTIVGSALVINPGQWSGSPDPEFSYAWRRCDFSGSNCLVISGATGNSYLLEGLDASTTIRVRVTAANSEGSSSVTTAARGPISSLPVNVVSPSITGSIVRGELLAADPGSWSGYPDATYTFQWQRCDSDGANCQSIDGQTESGYTVSAADTGQTLRLKTVASNVAGSVSAYSAPTSGVQGTPENTAAPSISGSAVMDQTLTASEGSWTGTPSPSYSYQWQRCDIDGTNCSSITSAGESTYKVQRIDGAKRLQVRVTAQNTNGASSSTSDQTSAAKTPPLNLNRPVLSGSVAMDEQLSVTDGSWDGYEASAYSYQWERCDSLGEDCSAISGQTGNNHTISDSDANHTLRAKVTAENSVGSAVAYSATSDLVVNPPVNQSLPLITGIIRVGQTLTGTAGGWSNSPYGYAYQWQRCFEDLGCRDIPGATSGTYLLQDEDTGLRISLLVIASNSSGSAQASSDQTEQVLRMPLNTEAPSISGSSKLGETLQASEGKWTAYPAPTSYQYQWQRCNSSGGECVDIDSASSSSYTLTADDVSKKLKVKVTAINSEGQGSATSAASEIIVAPPANVALPVLSGSFKVGELVNVSDGSWSGYPTPEIKYQWRRCDGAGMSCVDINGATLASYTLVSADAGKTIRALLTATNSGGSDSVSSSASDRVTQTPASTAPPTVTGTAQVGSTLSSSDGLWESYPEASLSYQWQVSLNGTSGWTSATGSGATSASYTIPSADSGKYLKIKITAENSAGSASAYSAVSSQVTMIPENTAVPAITGSAVTGSTLNASSGSWDGFPSPAYSYQWQVSSDGSSGWTSATGTGNATDTYIIPTADAGKYLRVQATATNSAGSAQAYSAASGLVLDKPTNTVLPTMSGTMITGSVAAATSGSWTGTPAPTYSYLWQVSTDGSTGWTTASGSGYNTASYTIGSYTGKYLRVQVTATNSADSAVAYSASSRVLGIVCSSAPVVSGSIITSQTITSSAPDCSGSYPSASISYQWQVSSNGSTSWTSATGTGNATASYTIPTSDTGKYLRVLATAANSAGSVQVYSAATSMVLDPPTNSSPPTIVGAPQVGLVSTSTSGSWSGTPTPAYAYQWQVSSDGSTSWASATGSGATTSSYTPASADSGKFLRLKLTATNTAGTAVAYSAVSSAVLELPSNTAAPAISGSVKVGLTVTASSGSWSGYPTPAYDYQWQTSADGSTGWASATGTGNSTASYTIPNSPSQPGLYLRVRVTATNAAGTVTASSSSSRIIGLFNTSAPALSGTAQVGQTLTSTSGDWSSSYPAPTYAYQWQVSADGTTGWASASGTGNATASYTIPSANAGKYLRVEVTATNSAGQASANSASTSAVTETPANISLPTVSGSATTGLTLSASPGSWSGTPAPTYAYQWQVSDSGSSGWASATGTGNATASYTIPAAYASKYLRVQVTATNSAGQVSATSAATSAITQKPVSTSLPAISGTPGADVTLNVSSGVWDAYPSPTYTYQWQRCSSAGVSCSDISGAINPSYLLVAADNGNTLRVQVTAQNSAGSTTALSAVSALIVLDPVNSSLPTVSGTARKGLTLSASDGSWSNSPTSFTYQWQRCSSAGVSCSDIAGANANTYLLLAADVNHRLLVEVTARNAYGSGTASSTAYSNVLQSPENTSVPIVSGTAKVAATLSASSGSWDALPAADYSYQWQVSDSGSAPWSDIPSATSSSYTVASGDSAKYLRVKVKAQNSEGYDFAYSASSAQVSELPAVITDPAVSGTANVGQTVTASSGTWSGFPAPSYAYQWQVSDSGSASWSDISSATSASYVIAASNSAKFLRVKVTATNLAGSVAGYSSSTSQVRQIPTLTTAPAISGTSQVGQALTASAGSWDAYPSPTYTYQWQSSSSGSAPWSDIAGASFASFTPVTAQAGLYLRVVVTATNSVGSTLANSSATATVKQTPENTALPAVSGTATVGGSLTASSGAWNGYPVPTYSYQWQVSSDGSVPWSDLAGATGTSYAPLSSDAGKYLRVKVTATNSLANVAAYSLSTSQVTQSPVNTVLPGISGATQVGISVGSSPGTWSALPAPVYSYQWQLYSAGSWANISGASSSSYTPVSSDVGQMVRVAVTASNSAGSSVAYSASSAVAGPPELVSAPVISGSLLTGSALTASSGTWSGYPAPTYAYQWQVSANGTDGWSDIPGASSASYTIQASDAGKYLRVKVVATNSSGAATGYSAVSSQVLQLPVNNSVPVVSGQARSLDILSATAGSWSGYPSPSYTYKWQVSANGTDGFVDAAGAGVSSAAYTIPVSEIGKYLRVKVTAQNSAGSTVAYSSVSAKVEQKPVNTALPSVSGVAQVGSSLSSSSGSWDAQPVASYSYKWQVSASGTGGWALATGTGAATSTYTVDASDSGQYLRVEVTAQNSAGSTAAYSAASSPASQLPALSSAPSISGTVQVGLTLSSSTGTWQAYPAPTYAYLWQVSTDGSTWVTASGSGYTTASYTVPSANAGNYLRVRVTATNSVGSVAGYSASTVKVVQLPGVATDPAVSGSTVRGSALAASDGSWSGNPTPTLARAWYRCSLVHGSASTAVPADCAAIDSATASSYTTTSSDDNNYIAVRVTATNSGGQASRISATTALIGTAPVISVEPSIGGSAVRPTTLTAADGSAAGVPTPTVASRAWYRCTASSAAASSSLPASCSLITSETASTYTPADADNGKYILLAVTYSNSFSSLTRYSASTASIKVPSSCATPTISGSFTTGGSVSASASCSGSPTPSVSYQWQVSTNGSTSWTSATGTGNATASYTVASSDAGKYLRARVSASNTGGSTTADSDASAQITQAVANTALPVITGTARSGQSLSASSGTWDGFPAPTYAYQWQVASAATGATWTEAPGAGNATSSYTVAAADASNYLRVRVTATNSVNSDIAYSSSTASVTAAPINTSLPSLSGTTVDGQTLTAAAGSWTGNPTPTYTYQWQVASAATGATWTSAPGAGNSTASYVIAASDVTKYLRVQVTATNSVSPVVAHSSASNVVTASTVAPSPITSPVISGTASIGQALTASSGSWAGTPTPTYAYQWQTSANGSTGWTSASGTGNATSSYTVASADAGNYLRVQVTATNSVGAASASSAATSVVTSPPLPVVLPVITGTARSTQTLTASSGTWTGVPTPTYAYQWQTSADGSTGWTSAAGTGNATASYTVTAADAGNYLRVQVTATNSVSSVTASSAATSAVTALPINTVLPAVTGAALTPIITGAITASNGNTTFTRTAGQNNVWDSQVYSTESCTTSCYATAKAAHGTLFGLNSDPATDANYTSIDYAIQYWGTSTYVWQNGVQILAAAGGLATDVLAVTYDGVNIRYLRNDIVLHTTARAVGAPLFFDSSIGVSSVALTSVAFGNSKETTTGSTLTASSGTWTGTPTPTYSYQWQVSADGTTGWTSAAGTGNSTSSYTIQASDAGKYLRVQVTATNSAGSSTISSAATASVTAAPLNTAVPAVTGTASSTQTLTASSGTWTGTPTPTYTYQWQVAAAATGATWTSAPGSGNATSSYTVAAADAGKYLRVQVTATNSVAAVAEVSAATASVTAAPINTALPAVSGSAQVDASLSASSGSWTGTPTPTYTYQWQVAAAATGATWTSAPGVGNATSSYIVAAADAGKYLRIQVTASNTAGPVAAASTATAAVTQAAACATPSFSGTPGSGQVLLASASCTGAPTPTLTYQWQVSNDGSTSWIAASGAGNTTASYTVAAGDAGKYVRVTVTGANSSSSSSASSLATRIYLSPVNTALPLISGTAQSGQTLNATSGSWTGYPAPTYSYLWQVSDDGSDNWTTAPGSGNSSAAYVAAAADAGKYLRVQVTATNLGGSTAAQSAASTRLTGLPTSTALPVISGTAQAGQDLTATSGSWTGYPAPTYAYQWQVATAATGATWTLATGTGATSITYTAASADAGKYLRVQVTATNSVGSSLPAYSAASSLVAARPAPVNTALPVVSGSAQTGQILSATAGSWNNSPTSYAYQWQVASAATGATWNNATGTGSNTSSYSVAVIDAGQYLRVQVTATNESGSTAAQSAATAAITALPVNTGAPLVSGSVVRGSTLTATNGSWSGAPTPTYSNVWYRCATSHTASASIAADCAVITSATLSTYSTVAADDGKFIAARITALNSSGSASYVSATSSAITYLACTTPVITGTAATGQVISTSNTCSGTPTPSVSYQWQISADGSTGWTSATGTGNTASSYTVPAGDAGKFLRVQVTGSNTAGSSTATSAAAQFMLAPVNTVLPVIAGTTTPGSTLTASTGTWTAAPTATYSYQWQRCDLSGNRCTNIGTNASTYALANADAAYTIKVQVTASNAAGSVAASSAITSAIASASGCTLTTSGLYTIHTCTTTGSSTINTYRSLSADYLVVGGGGSGGNGYNGANNGGGGGGGGVLIGTTSISGSMTISLNVGAGGAAGQMAQGSSSNAMGVTAIGGGYGGGRNTSNVNVVGGNGASGGGGGPAAPNGGGSGSQGSAGAAGNTASPYQGGGGGGAAQAGNSAGTGYGGNGLSSSITGVSVYYGGGGGGAGDASPGSGGLGGGASGITFESSTPPINATANTGGGGAGGASRTYNAAGSSGGSGIVIVRYKTAAVPVNTVLPTVSGTANNSLVLAGTAGTWTGEPTPALTYQWQVASAATGATWSSATGTGATSLSYTVAAADIGQYLRLTVTGSSTSGITTASSAASSVVTDKPINTVVPAVTGTANVGSTLTSDSGTWTGAAPIGYAYQWQVQQVSSAILGTTGNRPYGVAVDSAGNVYTSNLASNNVSKITPAGVSTTLGTTGAWPSGITIDSAGNVYTSNSNSNNVSKITPAGVSTTLGATGTSPFGITIDSAGNVYTSNSNSNNVSKITPAGVSTTLGTTGNNPYSITVDSSGNVYTANYSANTVSKITPAGVSTVLGTTGNSPYAITVDSSGNVYTANYSSNNVSKITPSGVSTILAATGTGPNGITLDAAGNLYTANNAVNNVSKITPAGVSTVLGTTGGSPSGITLDSAGNVYTSNTGANNVTKIGYAWTSATGAGANTSSYIPAASDSGKTLRSQVTASNSYGSTVAYSTETSVNVAPANSVVPVIAGTTTPGSTLTATSGTWTGSPTPTYAYQWQRCDLQGDRCTNIGTNSSTYTLVNADAAYTIKVQVTGSNVAGSASASSALTSAVASASGCTVTASGGYTIHSCTTTGSSTINTYRTLSADYLVIGGGGGGGGYVGGGGGAGGFVEGSQSLIAGSYPITVGAGGANEANGGNSIGFSKTALGGGAGARYANGAGVAGGSGGGAGAPEAGLPAGGAATQPSSASGGYGYRGGNVTGVRTTTNTQGMGGGGAGNNGQDASANITSSGGAGRASSITGTSYYYSGGGGGGGFYNNGGSGGLGGGGGGGSYNGAGTGGAGGTGGTSNGSAGSNVVQGPGGAGAPNTGGGGGGTGHNEASGGGGSGIVIVRYKTAAAPVNTALPTVSGAVNNGSVLTGNAGTWTGEPTPTLTYQWQVASAATGATWSSATGSGATSLNYTPASADVGQYLRLTVTGTSTSGITAASSAASSMVTDKPINTVVPAVSGVANVGSSLTSNSGTWTGATPISYAYQWQVQQLNSATLGTAGSGPTGITVDSAGNIYTANWTSNNVTKITPAGVSTVLGTTGTNPRGITIDSAGNIYTVNYGVNNVSKITPAGVSTILGTTGSIPYGITIDSAGNIYTANKGSDNVSKITPAGVSTILATTDRDPTAITIDSSGNIYTVNTYFNNVSKITPAGVSTILGSTGNSSNIGATAQIAVDSAGNVYTSNSYWDNVSKITPAGVSTILGTTGDYPQGIAVDSAGNIYTANAGSNNVSKITPGGTSTILGTTGTNPVGITIDSAGNIYTANGGSDNVSKITAPTWVSATGAGATTASYVPAASDSGKTLRSQVTASNSYGSTVAYSTETSVNVAPVNSVVPFILLGPATPGQTLNTPGSSMTATSGTWTGSPTPTYAYQWQRCDLNGLQCTNVGTNSASYTLVNADAGQRLKAIVTASNVAGSASAQNYSQTVDSASGCTVTTSGGYTIHSCTTTGSSTLNTYRTLSADYLVVAGGGGGGSFGGGGGAGGMLTGSQSVAAGSYAVTVGDGGAGQATSDVGVNGVNGANSIFAGSSTITAVGGGGGGSRAGASGYIAKAGNSGGSGGGSSSGDTGTQPTVAAGTSGQGSAGGQGMIGAYIHGGGGGASQAGANGVTGAAGKGGDGLASSISGSSVTYAGGGGAGNIYQTATVGAGGSGGGGSGGSPGAPGTSNRGGGGGGGAYTTAGGKGGSGIVIVRYKTAAAPVNTVLPTVPGAVNNGSVLTGTAGTWTGEPTPALTYQWQVSANGSTGWSSATGSGATSLSYTVASADVGQYLRLTVTGTSTSGITAASSSASSVVTNIPVNSVVPTVTGAAIVAGSLSASTGSWTGGTPTSYSYQWQVSANGSSGWTSATGTGNATATYVPAGVDAGQFLRVSVIANSATGSSVAAYSVATASVTYFPINTVAPAVSGSTLSGQTLTATSGTWTGLPTPTYTYQWQVASAATGAAWTSATGTGNTSAIYTPAAADASRYLRVTMTAANTAGAASASSNALGPVQFTVPTLAWQMTPSNQGSGSTTAAGTWTLGGGAASSVECQAGSGAWGACASSTTNTWTLGAAGSDTVLNVRATNLAGTSATLTKTVHRNAAAPTVSIASKPPDYYWQTGTFTYTATGVGSCSWVLNDAPWGGGTSSSGSCSGGSIAISAAQRGGQGYRRMTVTVTNADGSASAAAAMDWYSAASSIPNGNFETGALAPHWSNVSSLYGSSNNPEVVFYGNWFLRITNVTPTAWGAIQQAAGSYNRCDNIYWESWVNYYTTYAYVASVYVAPRYTAAVGYTAASYYAGYYTGAYTYANGTPRAGAAGVRQWAWNGSGWSLYSDYLDFEGGSSPTGRAIGGGSNCGVNRLVTLLGKTNVSGQVGLTYFNNVQGQNAG